MMIDLPNVKIGETVAIQDGIFVGYYGTFKGWYYRYKQGWRCKVDIFDGDDELKDVEFSPEQIL